MDDQTLESLKAAFIADTTNLPLLQVLLDAYRKRGFLDRAMELIRSLDAAKIPPHEARLTAAEICVEKGEGRTALALLAGETARELALKARAWLVLGDVKRGIRAYEEAVGMDPLLEDSVLAQRLSEALAAAPEGPGGLRDEDPDDEGKRQRVFSNDDTTEEDIQRMLQPVVEAVSFKDVGGLEAIKKQIRKRIILPFQKPGLFQRFRKRVGGGILLYGPPGCGKTLLARATAGECKAAFFNVGISDILNMYIGESESRLHALFEKARASAPAVVFFDEIEALGGKRQYSHEGTSAKLVSQFLSEMDGFVQANDGVLILGATNVPWAVDPAFRRPGRFDRVLFVPPPDEPARRAVLKILLSDRPVSPDIQIDAIARRTSGFSGADLKNLVESGADEAIEETLATGREVSIGNAHLKAALEEIRPTTLEWLTTARNYARYANEAGQYDEVLEFLKRHGKS